MLVLTFCPAVRRNWHRSAASVLIVLWTCLAASNGQGAVRFLPDKKLWVIDTERTSYVIGINELNGLQNVYWGKRLYHDAELQPVQTSRDYAFESREGMSTEEYPGWGGMRYTEPCLKVTFPAGARDLVLRYVSHNAGADTLDIRLKDIQYELFVTLRYQVYPRHDVLRKSAHIENRLSEAVALESAQSGVWYVPAAEQYRLNYLAGRWAAETQLIQEPLQQGLKVLESRRGNTSHQNNPWFAIDRAGQTGDESGWVWFGALGWSGNWRITVEQTPNQQVRVTGGLNTFDFSYPLNPGESLETPPFFGGFTDAGLGEASRLLHRFQREQILPAATRSKLRPVLYNSWEATLFNVNEQGQRELAEKAARIGVELFVMDDGWFGKRNDDHAGLGDWFVNRQKFPNGLKPLIDHVNKLGMEFGLWVEPEMVNPDSDLYRKHPDWAIHFPGRPRTEGRNQLILNMARDDVKDYIFGLLDRLLAENNIRFIKWDMNRHITEPGWPSVSPAEQRKLYVTYVANVYEIFDRLRAKHPKVEIESCSGGGGRVDLGILQRVEQVWPSDNTEAFDRLRIQDGFSHAYTPKVMMAWVTDVPNMNKRSTPLKYRFLVSMMGSLGIGANLNHWSKEDFELATKMIAYYKQVRGSVQEGRLYRLASPREGELTANQYVSEDGQHAVLFAFLRSQQFNRLTPAIRFRGLEEKALYRVKTVDDKPIEKQDTLSGAYLMNRGLHFQLTGDFDSTSVALERIQ